MSQVWLDRLTFDAINSAFVSARVKHSGRTTRNPLIQLAAMTAAWIEHAETQSSEFSGEDLTR